MAVFVFHERCWKYSCDSHDKRLLSCCEEYFFLLVYVYLMRNKSEKSVTGTFFVVPSLPIETESCVTRVIFDTCFVLDQVSKTVMTAWLIYLKAKHVVFGIPVFGNSRSWISFNQIIWLTIRGLLIFNLFASRLMHDVRYELPRCQLSVHRLIEMKHISIRSSITTRAGSPSS